MEPFDSIKRWSTKYRFKRETKRVYDRMDKQGVNRTQIDILVNDSKFMEQVIEIARDYAKGSDQGQADAESKLLKMGDTKALVALALLNEAARRNITK